MSADPTEEEVEVAYSGLGIHNGIGAYPGDLVLELDPMLGFVFFVELEVTLGGRYRGTSLIRNSAPLGPYSRNMPKALWRP